jgi:cell division protein FtsB
MKWVTALLLCLLVALQHRLWFGKNSIPDYLSMQKEVIEQRSQNDNLKQRNSLLIADIEDLKIGLRLKKEPATNLA